MDKSKEEIIQIRDSFREAADICDEMLAQLEAETPDQKTLESIVGRFIGAFMKIAAMAE